MKWSRKAHWMVGITLVLFLLAGSSPSFAAGCAWENCWVCVSVWWGLGGKECSVADGDSGRLCCNTYEGPLGTTDCRAFDDWCYGIIIRDVF